MNKIIEFYKKYKNIIHLLIILIVIVILIVLNQKILGLISGICLSAIKFFEYKNKEKDLVKKLNDYDIQIKQSNETIEMLLEKLKLTQEEKEKILEELSNREYNESNYDRETLLKWLNKV